MKFAEFYEAQLEKFPNGIRNSLFHYSMIIQNIDREKWKDQLYQELKKCQRTLFPTLTLPCFQKLSDTEKLSLCELCSEAFRKACKKIEKHLQVPALSFYSKIISSYEYPFLGGAQRTALKHGAIECPICFETVSNYCILRCGHATCIQCTEKLWGNLQDTEQLANTALVTQNTCPICRAVLACHPSFIVIRKNCKQS
jgi:Zinc finger, C3HC4 type (RING finger)